MTFFVARIDLRTGLLCFSNAGHNFPFHLHHDGKLKPLLKTNNLLGYSLDTQFDEQSVQLEVGDSLVFYTDGLTENENSTGEMWGEQRLRGYLRAHHQLPAQELLDGLVKEAYTFYGEQALNDDTTLIACKVRQPFPVQGKRTV